MPWVRTDQGVRGFLVPRGTPGFTADITNKLSLRASIQRELGLDGVRLSAGAVLPGAASLRAPFTCLNEARYGIIWGVRGAVRDYLDAAIGYSRERGASDGPSPVPS